MYMCITYVRPKINTFILTVIGIIDYIYGWLSKKSDFLTEKYYYLFFQLHLKI